MAVANTASVATTATTSPATNSAPAIVETVPTASMPAGKAKKTENPVEDIVKNYFADIPVLAEVARCESSYRHIDSTGALIRGVVNKADVGVMQINEYYHLEKAQDLGYDLHNIEGNMAFAKYLYEKYGTEPWSASEPCWGATAEALKHSQLAKTESIEK